MTGARASSTAGRIVLGFDPGATRERDAADVARRLAAIDARLSRLLAGGEAPAPSGGAIEVELSGTDLVGLELAVARAVLGERLSIPRSGRWPDALVLGLAEHASRRDGESAADPVLAQWLAACEDFKLEELLARDARRLSPFDLRAARSFAAHLWEQGGAPALARFLGALEDGDLTGAARAAYGASLAELGERWHRRSVAASPGKLDLLGVFGRTLSFWRPHPGIAVLLLLMLGVQQLFNTVYALGLKSIVDGLLEGRRDLALGWILGGLGVAFLAAAAASLYGEQLTAKISIRILNDLRRRMFDHLQRLSTDFFMRTKTGDIMSRFSSDLETLKKSLTERVVTALTAVIGLAINVPMLFAFDWRLAALAVVLLPLTLLTAGKAAPSATEAGYRLKKSEARMITGVQENVRAQAVVKAFNLQDHLRARFQQDLDELDALTVKADFRSELVGVIPSLGILAIQLGVTAVGAWMATAGRLTAGALVAFLTLLTKVSKDTYELAKKVLPAMIKAGSGLRRIDELLYELPQIEDAPGAAPLPPLEREIALEDVTFSYTGDAPNLNAVSLRIPRGARAAFVGPSGSGKSSVLNLVMRFYDPQRGAVTFDGVDARAISLASLRSQLAIVFQDNFLFNTSIRENIRMGRTGASDADVVEAAKAAALHDIVLKLPGGYDTDVGEGGSKLSGGQRQRVAIARAMLRDPAVLVLDEATSALDPATEAAVNETIERLSAGRTVLSVTHRLASIQRADRIFVLCDGRLAESGAHDELLASGGVYANLWRKQQGFDVSDDGRQARVDAERLRHLSLFAEVEDRAFLESLAREFSSEFYERGQAVLVEGQAVNRLFILVRGRAEVLSHSFVRPERQIGTLEDGDAFETLALLRDEPCSSTVRTLTPCLFITLRREQFLAALEASRAMASAATSINKQRYLERLFGPRVKGARPAPVAYSAADILGLGPSGAAGS